MAVATKPRPTAHRDAEARARLADAKTTLASVRAELQAAAEAHDAAVLAYGQQQSAVADIETRIADLAGQYRRVHPAGREEIWRLAEDCRPALQDAKLPLSDLGRAEAAAASALGEAEAGVTFAQMRVREAAAAVLRAEAPAITETMIPALREAFQVILTYGPDLLWLIEHNIVGHDVINALGEGPRRMLNPFQSWPEFETRYRGSPWRGAVAALVQEDDVPLPTVPAA